MKRKLTFWIGCSCEVAMLALALLWDWLFQWWPFVDLHWNLAVLMIGVVAAMPPLILFIWMLNSKLKICLSHRHILESLLRPLFENWSVLQLAAISIIAGICEEAFFRGAVQGSLADHIGLPLALVLASTLFGAVHPITWTYALSATFIGAYLGLLWIWTGNLLAPIVAHAVYDFLALVYLLRG